MGPLQASEVPAMSTATRLIEPRSVFQATAVNHISYGVSDVPRTRDFFMDVFGMKCVFDDGIRCSVAFGSPEHAIYITPSRRPDKSAYVDHLAFSVAGFDLKRAEATLQQYGFHPEFDGDFAWTIEDPDGMRLQICAESGVFPGAALPGATAAGKIPSGDKAQRPGVFQTTAVNHVAYTVADYARARDFYVDLLGMRIAFEDGLKCSVEFGEPPNALYLTKSRQPGGSWFIDHLAFSVANFDLKDSEAKLKQLGLHPEDDGAHAWTIQDPDGYRIQVCAERGVYPGAARDPYHRPA